ncbi:MAG: DUF1499 domain-containing protein [Methylococcales bacterium]
MAQQSASQTPFITLLSHSLMVFVMAFNAISLANETNTKTEINMSPQLPPCPNSPNCVSSTDTDASHTIAALNFEGSTPEKAMQSLQQVLLSITEKVQVSEDGLTVHAEFKSAVFGFIDDVDVVLNAGQQRIEIRSASRTGHSDFGVNRRRVESIRQAFNQALMQGR